jgi:hypothetical protein
MGTWEHESTCVSPMTPSWLSPRPNRQAPKGRTPSSQSCEHISNPVPTTNPKHYCRREFNIAITQLACAANYRMRLAKGIRLQLVLTKSQILIRIRRFRSSTVQFLFPHPSRIRACYLVRLTFATHKPTTSNTQAITVP